MLVDPFLNTSSGGEYSSDPREPNAGNIMIVYAQGRSAGEWLRLGGLLRLILTNVADLRYFILTRIK